MRGAEASLSATPITPEIVPDVADLHLEAFAEYMNSRIGRRYVRSFIDWFRRQEDAIALAACADGAVVGYVVGAPLGYERHMNRDLLVVAAIGMLARPWIFLDAQLRRTVGVRLKLLLGGKATKHEEPELPPPTMSLVGIGVSPKFRGRGVGDRLMDAFEAEARARRMKSLRLSVYENNTAARKLYERHGWLAYSRLGNGAMYYSVVFRESSEPCRSR